MSENKFPFESSTEDTVQCFLFSTSLPSCNQKLWEQLCDNVNNTITKLSKDYIWHRDKFKVHLPIENKSTDNLSYLLSTTNFAENIEDEWFIVYIILELTRIYEHLIVKIKDNDGDFLLIEAAESLPSWIKPDTSENRVFIYKSHLHIIPPNLVDVGKQVGLQEAIEFITKMEEQTQASADIEKLILSRVGSYPEKMKENFHTAIVELPLHISGLLHLNPDLIAPFVSAYCDHDAIDAKTCKDLNFENCVTVQVKFTKFLYAMLMNAALIKNIKCAFTIEKDKKKSIGYKLACGYHMIMKPAKNMYDSKEFHLFIKSLEKNGYFRNNIEGSRQHQELFKKAKDYFASVECPVSLHISNKILNIMNSNEYTQTLELIKNNNISACALHEDDENWMNIEPEQLNNLLHNRYGKSISKNKNLTSPYNITSELTDFIKKTSDFEGMETSNDVDTENENIEFDVDEFTKSLEKFVNLLNCQDSDVDSDEIDIEEDISYSDQVQLDKELQLKLSCDPNEKLHSCESISNNLVQSMREEKASSGPASNLLKAIGLNKIDFLDSDDDLD